jgi:crotonobetainyl-CoA:carnitine CoA-transferase CaiB-like acyl-CoA transferase
MAEPAKRACPLAGIRVVDLTAMVMGPYSTQIMADMGATIMALFHRARTGEGQEVEVAMFETMASFMLVEHANGAMFDQPLGAAHYPRVVAPNRKPYRTRSSPPSSSGRGRSTRSMACWRRPSWSGRPSTGSSC